VFAAYLDASHWLCRQSQPNGEEKGRPDPDLAGQPNLPPHLGYEGLADTQAKTRTACTQQESESEEQQG
jgi:hypothetical protein